MFCLVLAIFPLSVQADAWWGEGAMDKDWILKHGGSLVNYTIKGKANPDDYKVRMYLMGARGAGGGAAEMAERGDVVEVEHGSEATFDDGINNLYKIIVFKGTDKKISTEFFVRPGEVVDIHFDLYEEEVYQSKKIVYRGDRILLTPESSKYVKPADLEFSKIKKTPEPEEKENSSSSEGEKAEENAMQEEREETKKDSSKGSRESESKKKKETERNKEEKDKRRKEELEIFQSRMETQKEKMESLESDFSQEWNEERDRSALIYLFKGPSRKRIESLQEKLIKLKNEFLETKKLEDLAFDEETKRELDSLIADMEEKIKQKLDQLKEINKETSFWERVKSF